MKSLPDVQVWRCTVNVAGSKTGNKICAAAGELFIYRKKILQESQFWLSFLILGRNGEIKIWLKN